MASDLVERVAAARPQPSWYSWRINEARPAVRAPAKVPERTGFPWGIPPGGLNEVNAGVGASTQTDRRSELQQLYESYLACPWSWACVQAVARTITAGGLIMDWNSDTGEADEEAPDKPPAVLAAERLIAFCNPKQNIRQLMRNVVVDLEVFGDAYIEVTWWAGVPVAIWNLDVPTTVPVTDDHGAVTKYVQTTDYGQTATFTPEEVIHISLDAPRSGVFGVSPTQANLLPITAWLFAAATGKEMFRKGLPPTIHADMPAGVSPSDQVKWRAQYAAQNIGPRNIGTPIMTKGGAVIKEIQAGKISDVLGFLDQKRDEIIAGYGVPPSKVSIIEAGNLGGGTGEEQDMTYRIDKCAPIAELILEAFNFAIVKQGFGVEDWHAKFRDVDYRSSEVREKIRDSRIRNGSYTVNKARTEIGEPPVDGGDDAVIIDRQNLVLVRDLGRMSDALITKAGGGPAALPGGTAPDGVVIPGAPGSQDDGKDGGGKQGGGKPAEAVSPVMLARYRARLAEAQRAMGITEAGGGDAMRQVYAQLAPDFPADAISWVRDVSWDGPVRVPLQHIDDGDRDHWDASRQPGKVAKIRKKLRKKLMRGEMPKPLVLVRWPGKDRDVIADGHHHFLAAEAEGQHVVWAYVGHVPAEDGPWSTFATREKGRDAA